MKSSQNKRRKEKIMEKERVELLLERSFLFDPNIYMTVVVTIEGEVGEEEICEAVKKAYTQNQTTMSKVVLDEQGKVYLEEMEEPFEVIIQFRYAGQNPDSPPVWWRISKDKKPQQFPTELGISPVNILLLYDA